MTKPLANKTKHQQKTHRVVVEIDVNADSQENAEIIVDNSIDSPYFDTNIISSHNLN